VVIYLACILFATAVAATWQHGMGGHRTPAIKASFVSGIEWFGELGMFCARLFRAAITPPFEIAELIRQCDSIGSKSFPLVALAGAATGVVLSLETRDSLVRFGAKSFFAGRHRVFDYQGERSHHCRTRFERQSGRGNWG